MTLALETTTGLTVQLRQADDWFEVCGLDRLVPGRGVAALLPDGRQAAGAGAEIAGSVSATRRDHQATLPSARNT